MKSFIITTAFLIAQLLCHAQGKFMPTCFPSLLLPVDARSAGMAGAGTALDADISAISSNPARLAMLEGQHNVAIDYLPYSAIAKDAKKIGVKYALASNKRNTLAIGVNYYTSGAITLRNDVGAEMGQLKQSEYFVTLGYGRQITNNGFLGVSLRYLYQGNLTNLDDNNVVSGGAAVGGDIGYLQNIILSDDYEKIRLGVSLQNLGSKLNGTLYQPMNFSFGLSYSNGFYDEDKNSNADIAFTAGFQIDKPLIPSLPVYDAAGNIIEGKNPNRSVFSNLFSTWADAPGGFKENLKQLRYSIYAETLLNRVIAFRAGYAHENIDYGNRNYLSIGAGINWTYSESDYGINLAYVQPIGTGASYSPLRNAFSLQLLFQFGRR